MSSSVKPRHHHSRTIRFLLSPRFTSRSFLQNLPTLTSASSQLIHHPNLPHSSLPMTSSLMSLTLTSSRSLSQYWNILSVSMKRGSIRKLEPQESRILARNLRLLRNASSLPNYIHHLEYKSTLLTNLTLLTSPSSVPQALLSSVNTRVEG